MVEWYATHRGYPTRLADVSVTFLHAEMKELVYVRLPSDFVHPEWESGTQRLEVEEGLVRDAISTQGMPGAPIVIARGCRF